MGVVRICGMWQKLFLNRFGQYTALIHVQLVVNHELDDEVDRHDTEVPLDVFGELGAGRWEKQSLVHTEYRTFEFHSE